MHVLSTLKISWLQMHEFTLRVPNSVPLLYVSQYLFLSQHHASSCIVVLKYILKSDSVMPPALLFLFKIALTLQSFCDTIQILQYFQQFCEEMSLVFWKRLYWIFESFGWYGIFNTIDSYIQFTWNILLFLCVHFSFLHEYFIVITSLWLNLFLDFFSSYWKCT